MLHKRFGRWIVLRKDSYDRRGKKIKWLCLCDCGAEKAVYGASLRNGRSKSCGCWHHDQLVERLTLPPGEAAFNQLLNGYRQHARKRGFAFRLSAEQFRALTQEPCRYCGVYLSQTAVRRKSSFPYNGIDRLDSSKGYTKENSVAACGTCNLMKMGKTVAKFIAACKAVAKHHDH